MNHLDKLFGNPVQRIDAIIDELFACPEVKETIRRQKICTIEDIFRCGKALNGFCVGYSDYLNPDASFFDYHYDKTLDELELTLAELSAKLKQQAMSAIEWRNVR